MVVVGAAVTYLHGLLIVGGVMCAAWVALRLIGDLIAWWTDTIEDDWHD